MIELPDVNVLVALHFEDHQHHAAATDWLRRCRQFATTPLTETGFVRVSMNPVITDVCFSGQEALEALRRLRGHPRAVFWPDDASLIESSVASRILSGHRQVPDLHLLQLAASRGGVLTTFDAKVIAPLTASEARKVRLLQG